MRRGFANRRRFQREADGEDLRDLFGGGEYPVRHRHGNPLGGKLFHEQVDPFPGNCACDRYAAARRRTSFPAPATGYDVAHHETRPTRRESRPACSRCRPRLGASISTTSADEHRNPQRSAPTSPRPHDYRGPALVRYIGEDPLLVLHHASGERPEALATFLIGAAHPCRGQQQGSEARSAVAGVRAGRLCTRA